MAPEVAEKERMNLLDQQYIVMRIITELWLAGVFRFISDASGQRLPAFATQTSSLALLDPPPLSCIKEILAYDTVNFSGRSVALMLLKFYGKTLTGRSRAGTTLEASSLNKETPLVPVELQKLFETVFSKYCVALQERIAVLARQIQTEDYSMERAELKFGNVQDSAIRDNLMKTFESLKADCQIMCDYLSMEMIKVTVKRHNDSAMLVRMGNLSNLTSEENFGIFEDEEQRRFYEDLVKLPPSLSSSNNGLSTQESEVDEENAEAVKEAKAKEAEEKETEALEEEAQLAEELDSLSLDSTKFDADEDEDTDEDIAEAGADAIMAVLPGEDSPDNSGVSSDPSQFEDVAETKFVGNALAELLIRLQAQISKQVVDQAAIDFVMMNNRASRKKLLKFLSSMDVTERHKIPLYCRFVANIEPIAPDVALGLTEYHHEFFRYLQRKRSSKALYSRRLYNALFLSELTKFELIPKLKIFHKFRYVIEHLDHPNVDILYNLLEGCGRYLYRKPNTRLLMHHTLKVLDQVRKSGKRYILPEDRLLISNALSYVNPPPVTIKVKQRSVIEQYIRKIIYTNLKHSNANEIIDHLRRLDWNETNTFHTLRKVFFKIWKVDFANISTMAYMVSRLSNYYRSFSVFVADETLENIRRGLEINDFSLNQPRISQVIYLAELFNIDLLKRDVIFDTLYFILTFGHPNGQPTPGVRSPLDLPNQFFRIRLVCTLLDTSVKKIKLQEKHNQELQLQLDVFLAFFQYYIQTKENLSVDIEFQIRDTFNNFRGSSLKLHENLADAAKALENILALQKEGSKGPSPGSTEGAAQEDEPSLVDKGPKSRKATQDVPRSAVWTRRPIKEMTQEQKEQFVQEMTVAKRVHAAKEDRKANSEFEREFSRLLMDRLDTRRQQSGHGFDEPVPVISKNGSELETLKIGDENEQHEESYNGNGGFKVDLSHLNNGRNNHDANNDNSNKKNRPSKVAYTLMTRAGTKSQTLSLAVPADSKFVQSVSREQQDRLAQKEKIKSIVLRYEHSNAVDERQEQIPQIHQNLIPSLRYSSNRTKVKKDED